jgi:hypothetical protein
LVSNWIVDPKSCTPPCGLLKLSGTYRSMLRSAFSIAPERPERLPAAPGGRVL